MLRFVWGLLGAILLTGSAYAQPAPAPVKNLVPQEELPAEPPEPSVATFPPAEKPPYGPTAAAVPMFTNESCGCDGGCCNLGHPWRGAGDGCGCGPGACGPPGSRMWLDVDYLYWRVRGDFVPALVTTGPPGATVATAGVLPNATVILGNELINNEPRSGVRLNFGGWLNQSQTIGLQASGFILAERTTSETFSSNDGSMILARPFTKVSATAAPTQSSQVAAFPSVIGGSINFSERNSLEGFDAAFRGNACCGANWRLDALIGYRYLRFSESLRIQEQLLTGVNSPTVLALPVGTSIAEFDSFETWNTFNGLQIGLTGEARLWEKLTLLGTVKSSFGYVAHVVNINGATRFTPQDVSNRFGGLLALDSNIGNYRRSDAAMVPEVNLAAFYQVNRFIRIRVGYDLIYFANTQRAGSAIDLNIDRQRIPPSTNPTVNAPTFRFSNDNMLIEGVTAGLEFRF